jgi:protein-S-isoprenylcysteine O-methyltransferase Ste14
MTDVFKIIFVIGFISGAVLRRVCLRRAHAGYKEEITYVRKSALDLTLLGLTGVSMQIIPIIYLCTNWFDFADYPLDMATPLTYAGWLGAPVFACAIWLLWRSHVDLGRNWSPLLRIRKEHTLAVNGVYSRIRHPMYAAHWLWVLAQLLLLQNWIAGPAMLITFLPVYLLRTPHEEQMMIETFGDEYKEYMKRTGRIIPRFSS